MATKPDPQTITVTQAAALIERSTRWVQLRVREGWIRTDGRGRYPVPSVVRGALAYYEDQMQRMAKNAAANRVTDARTREIELRIAERSRALIPIEDAEAVVADLAGAVLSQLSGLPARVTRDLTLRRKIEAEVGKMIDNLRDHAAVQGAALLTGAEPVE